MANLKFYIDTDNVTPELISILAKHLKIEKGDKGETGDTGEKGEAGDKGEKGDKGELSYRQLRFWNGQTVDAQRGDANLIIGNVSLENGKMISVKGSLPLERSKIAEGGLGSIWCFVDESYTVNNKKLKISDDGVVWAKVDTNNLYIRIK